MICSPITAPKSRAFGQSSKIWTGVHGPASARKRRVVGRQPPTATIAVVDNRDEDGRRGEVAPGLFNILRRPVLLRRDAASEIRVQVLVQATVSRAEGRHRTVLGIRRK